MRHTPLRRNCEVDSRFLLNIQTEYIDHIRAAEADLAVAGWRQFAAVAKDVDVRKGNMHCYGTELASVGIVVEGISDLMTTVAATLAEPVNQGYLDFGLTHRTLLKCDSCNMAFFRVQ